MDNNDTLSFAQFVDDAMVTQGLSARALAFEAGISFRAITEARSGQLEIGLVSDTLSLRKRIGLMKSTPRLLKGLGADVEKWMTSLGLTDDNLRVARRNAPQWWKEGGPKTKIRTVFAQANDISSQPVPSQCVDELRKVQVVLGDLFTVEMLVRILLRNIN